MAIENHTFKQNAEGFYNVALAGKVSITDANGNVTYSDSLATALMSASAGSTVTVLSDLTEMTVLCVFNGVTLDLNGYKVTANGLVAFGGNVIDSTNDGYGSVAQLAVGYGNLSLTSSSSDMISVWDADNACYRFVKIRTMAVVQNIGEGSDQFKFFFNPLLANDAELGKTLLGTSEKVAASDLEYVVKLVCVKNGVDAQTISFSYDAGLISSTYALGMSGAMTLTVSGASNYESIKIVVEIAAKSGISYSEHVKTFEVQVAE